MSNVLRPAAEWELQSMVASLAERRIPVEVMGAGSKRSCGRPVGASAFLSTALLRGITLYEPTELVMSARSGTPLSQIEVELAARGQMLPFEPIDLGALLGQLPGQQTIGGVFGCNLSGSRRFVAGAARDHVLGVHAVNGRGEAFKSGGRVMKNVTGVDVARGITGSWGTLAIFSEVTFKVLPLPDDLVTLVFRGLTGELATELMCMAAGSPFEVSGAIHLTETLARRLKTGDLAEEKKSLTALRIENFSKSVEYRKGRLKELLVAFGQPGELDLDLSLKFWNELRRFAVLPYGPTQVWRISTAPRNGPKLVASIRRHVPVEAMYDWSGGLVWLEMQASADAGAADVRRAVASFGGHATLIRADDAVRREVQVFQPLTPAVARLTQGLKAAFDPAGILNPGRMYANL
ncbi:MAG: FAD-binding protein [Hyphomicrobium sp.]